jgi:uncharacterized protein with GYD domain
MREVPIAGTHHEMGGSYMPTYISLVNLTDQGIKEVKNAPERLRSFDVAAQEVGGKLVGFYLVLGQYDYVVITEAPDDQTAARLILGTIAQGSVRTQTMRAFPREELEQIARTLQ